MLAVLGMVGRMPFFTPSLQGKVELEDVEPLKGEHVAKYKKALGTPMALAMDRADII